MKEYESPILEIFKLKIEDIICTSGGLTDGGEGSADGDDTIFPMNIPYNN